MSLTVDFPIPCGLVIVLLEVPLSINFKLLFKTQHLPFAAGRQDDASTMLLLARCEISVKTFTDPTLMHSMTLTRKGAVSSVRIREGVDN